MTGEGQSSRAENACNPGDLCILDMYSDGHGAYAITHFAARATQFATFFFRKSKLLSKSLTDNDHEINLYNPCYCIHLNADVVTMPTGLPSTRWWPRRSSESYAARISMKISRICEFRTLGFWGHHSSCSIVCWTNKTLTARSLSPKHSWLPRPHTPTPELWVAVLSTRQCRCGASFTKMVYLWSQYC